MTELKKKIDKMVRDYYTSSKALTLYQNLKEFAYDVATEATKELQEELTEAKEILKKYLSIGVGGKITQNYLDVTKEAEQFLKNDSCPDVMCEDCTKEDCGIKKLGLV